jgi:hypothetical protein
VGTDYDVLADLGEQGNDHTAPSAGERPAQVASDLLHGRSVAAGDAVQLYVEDAAITAGGVFGPCSFYTLMRQATWGSGDCIAQYSGGSALPLLQMAGTSGNIQFRAPGATASVSGGQGFDTDAFRIAVGTWDLADQVVKYTYPDLSDDDPASPSTKAAAGSADADGGQLSLLATANGTAEAAAEIAAHLITRDLLSAAEEDTLYAYWRNTIVYTAEWDLVPFSGTRSTQGMGQPGPYPVAHEGVSGNTIQACETRLVGSWAGTDTDLGDPGDPGAGSRGSLEDLVVDQGLTGLVLIVHIGMNDASSGAVPQSDWQDFIRRLWSVGDGSVSRIVACTVTGRDDANQSNLDTFNTALPSLVSTLSGEGITITLADPANGWNVGTMNANALHPNRTGYTYMADAIYDRLVADGVDSALEAGTASLVCIGDSITEGDPTNVVGAYRLYLAKQLYENGIFT